METGFLDVIIDKLWAISTESNKDPLEIIRSAGECTDPKLSELSMIIKLLSRINTVEDKRSLLNHIRDCSGIIKDDELDSIPINAALEFGHDKWQSSRLYYDFIYRTRKDYDLEELIIISDIIQYLENICYKCTIYSNLIFYDPAIWSNRGTGVVKLSELLKVLMKDPNYIEDIIILYTENELDPPSMLLDLIRDQSTTKYPMKYGIFLQDNESGTIVSYQGFNSIIPYCIRYYDSDYTSYLYINNHRIAANHIDRSLIFVGDDYLRLQELLNKMILTYDLVELPLIRKIINKLDYLKFGL